MSDTENTNFITGDVYPIIPVKLVSTKKDKDGNDIIEDLGEVKKVKKINKKAVNDEGS